jgi:hypothetical protein
LSSDCIPTVAGSTVSAPPGAFGLLAGCFESLLGGEAAGFLSSPSPPAGSKRNYS